MRNIIKMCKGGVIWKMPTDILKYNYKNKIMANKSKSPNNLYVDRLYNWDSRCRSI